MLELINFPLAVSCIVLAEESGSLGTLRSRRSPAEGKPNYFVLPAGASKALLNALDIIRWAFALVLHRSPSGVRLVAPALLFGYGSCVHGVLPVGSAESLLFTAVAGAVALLGLMGFYVRSLCSLLGLGGPTVGLRGLCIRCVHLLAECEPLSDLLAPCITLRSRRSPVEREASDFL